MILIKALVSGSTKLKFLKKWLTKWKRKVGVSNEAATEWKCKVEASKRRGYIKTQTFTKNGPKCSSSF